MIYVGVDPGVTGAVAILSPSSGSSVHDLPLQENRRLDSVTFSMKVPLSILEYDGVMAALEEVNAMPAQDKYGKRSMGATSAMNFGRMAGALEGVLSLCASELVMVRPQVWKKYHGLIGTEKDAARLKAIELFPELADKLSRKKDSGRADALLIAAWLRATTED